MRWAAILVLAAACGSDHYGTYFLADGRASNVTFDHAEFFFGGSLKGAFASPTGPRKGEVYARKFRSTDLAVPAGTARLATYYVPSDGATDVGDYVLAIAYDANDKVVGAGDATGFPLAADREVIEVELPLEADPTVERWGASPGCVAWDRKHGRPEVAVVRDLDRDCDEVERADDCNDLLYCGPGMPCSTTPSLCLATCAIGCRDSTNTCTPSICLPDGVCNSPANCPFTPMTIPERLDCLAFGDAGHLDVDFPVAPDGRPCLDEFSLTLPDGELCDDPIMEYSQPLPDHYTFKVSPNGTQCDFKLVTPSGNPAFVGDHHLIVSIDPQGGGFAPRSTLFFGVLPVNFMTCPGSIPTTNTPEIHSCQ